MRGWGRALTATSKNRGGLLYAVRTESLAIVERVHRPFPWRSRNRNLAPRRIFFTSSPIFFIFWDDLNVQAMSLKDDLKKLLFGAKSAARSVGRKAEAQSQKLGQELSEQSKDYYHKLKKRMEDLDDEYRPKAKKAAGEARSFAEELVNEAWKKVDDLRAEPKDQEPTQPESAMNEEDKKQPSEKQEPEEPSFEDIFTGKTTHEPEQQGPPKEKGKTRFDELGEDVARAAGEAGKRAQEVSEKVGRRVLDTSDKINERLFEEGGKLWEKAKEKGEGLMGRFDDLVDKANKEAAKESMDDLTEQAREMEDDLERRVKERGGKSNAENLEADRQKGPLGGMDSFFDKAARYADGDYTGEGKQDKDVTIRKDPDYKPKENKGKVKGFDDRDGDGDEIIDDAIIDDDK